jgi:hypothetical protein
MPKRVGVVLGVSEVFRTAICPITQCLAGVLWFRPWHH